MVKPNDLLVGFRNKKKVMQICSRMRFFASSCYIVSKYYYCMVIIQGVQYGSAKIIIMKIKHKRIMEVIELRDLSYFLSSSSVTLPLL